MRKFADVARIENGYLVTYQVVSSRKAKDYARAFRPGRQPEGLEDVEDVEQFVVQPVADYCATTEEILVSVAKADHASLEIERLVKEGKLQPGGSFSRGVGGYIRQQQINEDF